MGGRRVTAPIAVAALVLVHVTALLARADWSRPVVFSGRFSWSMFAGPLSGRCAHHLVTTDAHGRDDPAPVARTTGPLRRVLVAEREADFVAVAGLLHAYVDDDRALAANLDDLLRRWWSTVPERTTHTLTDTLRCTTPDARPFARTLRLGPLP